MITMFDIHINGGDNREDWLFEIACLNEKSVAVVERRGYFNHNGLQKTFRATAINGEVIGEANFEHTIKALIAKYIRKNNLT